MIISDSSYKELADQVYQVESSKAYSEDKIPVVKYDTITDPETNKTYQVLLTQDNNAPAYPTPNGMQAMAVAPIVSRIHFLAHKSLFC